MDTWLTYHTWRARDVNGFDALLVNGFIFGAYVWHNPNYFELEARG